MILARLRREVCEANRALYRAGLVVGTFGNVSGIDRERRFVAIKPSGVPFSQLTPASIAIVSFPDGNILKNSLRPSTDMPTHLELYRAFPQIGGIAHAHSRAATAWAQARRPIPPLGTTHADHFLGPVPCTRLLRRQEICENYEVNTGRVIVERFARLDPGTMPAVLVAAHGAFAWGATPVEAVANAIALEYVAHLALETLRIAPNTSSIQRALLRKHFFRKHGHNAYYGQKDAGRKLARHWQED